MHTPGLPVSRPCVAAMNAAACSCRVSTSSIPEGRNDSTTSRFSSPGTPKMRSTPSFSSAATRRSDPLGIGIFLYRRPSFETPVSGARGNTLHDGLGEVTGRGGATHVAGADIVPVQYGIDRL